MVQFQVLIWDSRDEENTHVIRLFGKTSKGESVCVTTNYTPYFFVKIPKGMMKDALMRYIEDACYEDLITGFEVVRAKDVWGFQNEEHIHFYKFFVGI